MNSFIYEVIVYLVEAFISCIFLIHILKPKYSKNIHMVLWLEIVFLSMFISAPFSLMRIIFAAIIEFIFIVFAYEDKFAQKIKVFLFKEGILFISSVSSFTCYRNLINKDAAFWGSCHSENCAYVLLYLIVFSVLTSIILQFIKKIRGAEFPWVIGTQLIIGIGEVGAVLAIASTGGGVINSSESVYIMLTLVCMVSANISIGMLAPYLLQKFSLSNNMDFGQEISNMEFKYYETSVENERKLKEIRHDVSNHIQTIYALINSGENQRGLELINELRHRYALIEQIVYCENPVVNVILSNKKLEAEDKNIETTINIKDDLKNIPITDFDLSTVICNLLDNAIRGCVVSEQTMPKLIVEILTKNNYLVIRILNSCKISMNVESTDRIETTKSKSQTHGLGMPIVAGIAKKYHGDFVVSAQNGIFTATVVMSIKSRNNINA